MGIFSSLIKKFQGGSDAPVQAVVVLELKDIDELEEELICSDLGPELSTEFADFLRKRMKGFAGIGGREIKRDELPGLFAEFIADDFKNLNTGLVIDKQTVITMVGVNGVGKTTSAAKLACYYKNQGYKVLLVAADTFRAAATEQLTQWAERGQIEIVTRETDKDKPSGVVYKALQQTKIADYNIVIIDTAGRLQTKVDLMQELTKISDVITKNATEAKLETLLVLDASTGQNAISQADLFNQATKLNGIVLTKYDGSSKAGTVLSLARKFKLPVKFIGTGEGLADLHAFEQKQFLTELISQTPSEQH